MSLAAAFTGVAAESETNNTAPDFFRENAGDVPLHCGDDIIVCGAGSAGVVAACRSGRDHSYLVNNLAN